MAQLGFWNLAQQEPGRLALVAPDGREWSRADLLSASNRLTHGLRALGLEKGDCIAAVLPNSAEMLQVYLAAFQSGFYLSPINHHLTAPEVAYIVRDSEAKLFIGAERFADACRGAASEVDLPPERLFALGDLPGFQNFESLGAGQPDSIPAERAAGQVMNYTSGTTGKPKGVRRALAPLDPDTVASLTSAFLGMFGIQPDDDNVHICGSPLYHTAVLVFCSASLHLGHPVVLMDKWHPEDMLRLIEKYRVTQSHMVPTQFHRLLGLPEEVRGGYDVSSLRCMVHAAAPCPVETKKRMLEWWGDTIYEYYAATEGGGTLVTPEEWRRFPGTVGRPWPNAGIRILDEKDQDCPTDQPGTVFIKLGQADFRYKDDDKKTEENRRHGYFTVGDIGYLNDEGYLFLCDRKADMIISGGVNIYPAEIEAAIFQHPKVADVAAFGIPHHDWGEEVKAVIQAIDGVEPGEALAGEILAFCADRLAKYKTPRSIDFIAEMPRDPNGKLYKRKLRDPYWADRESAI
ncbi:MAG: acyl-CoA synthetase [Myxococcota bacterium]